MEKKIIDLNKSVYELCMEYPELPGILHDIGFVDIVKPGMLAFAGRFMTLKKGAVMKKISLDYIRDTLSKNGYDVTD